MHPLAKLDHRFVWHPFTQMRDWLQGEPIVIARGQGAWLYDTRGRKYLDGNSSIWTNLHGHNHPKLNAAITRQLKKIAHSSALGLANEPASRLAQALVLAASSGRVESHSAPGARRRKGEAMSQRHSLAKVFFSDDGSTAMEVALKLAYEFTRRTRGPKCRPRFLSLQGAYHGDTVGAVSLGHIDLFHKAYTGLLFKTDTVMAPYCYRCPFNRAQPERADARIYRRCHWECLGQVEQAFVRAKKRGRLYAGFVFEPLIQGAAGLIPQPEGWLRQAIEIARGHEALLIADEAMTGFGRCGVSGPGSKSAGLETPLRKTQAPIFACAREEVQPDLLCLAKGLTGGYVPMGATLTTQDIFDAFLGEYEEFKTFFHGHSYTANQMCAAAALASLTELATAESMRARAYLQQTLQQEMRVLWELPNVGDIRQVGLVAGVELVRNWRTRAPFDLRERAGMRVCEAMARRGVLTRPIGNVVVLMPPYCTTRREAKHLVHTLRGACEEVFG